MPKLQYPNNAPFALCLTHDVDRLKKQVYHYLQQGIKTSITPQLKQLLGAKQKEPYYNFGELLAVEKEYDAQSTFLFLHETVRRPSFNFMGRYRLTDVKARTAIELCLKNNAEIGFHGSFYSFNNGGRMQEEYQLLKRIAETNIVSTRQHFLNFDPQKTHYLQKKCGMKYDSTIGYSKTLGDELPSFPYITMDGLLEFPIAIMDTLDFANPAIYQAALDLLEKTARVGGVCTLDFHQCRFNAGDAPATVKLYAEILSKAAAKGGFIGSMKQIGDFILPQLEADSYVS